MEKRWFSRNQCFLFLLFWESVWHRFFNQLFAVMHRKLAWFFALFFRQNFTKNRSRKREKRRSRQNHIKGVYECILVAVFSWKRRPWASKTCPKTSSKVPVGSFWEPFSDWKMAQGKKGIVHRRFRGASMHSERCSDALRHKFGRNFRIVDVIFG